VKYLKLVSTAGGIALLLSASSALADIVKDGAGTPITTTPSGATQTVWVGSDTLNKVIATVTASITLTQITTYLDQGSGQGQRQMEGSPTSGTSEPACGPTDGNGYPEANPGCQEISPMSRQMDNKICEDDISTPGGASGTNTTAEALAVCGDAIVVITDNAAHAQTADDAASCATGTSDNGSPYVPNAAYAKAGKLRRSGTFTLDGSTDTYTVTDWKDVLRVVYTGCKNSGGTCAATSRVARCTDPVRKTLLNHWEYLVESGALAGDAAVSCGASKCPSLANGDGGVRQAYRRDDGSGTTGVFLQLLGLGAPILQRTGYIKLVPPTTVQIIPIPDLATPPVTTPVTPGGNMFCDGGDVEGFWHSGTVTPVAVTSTTLVTAIDPSAFGDPITRPCLSDSSTSPTPDNLCSFTGRVGVVRAIRSPGTGDATFPDYPSKQCTVGRFGLKKFVNTNTSLPICPDGTRPVGNQCNLPYFTADNGVTKDFRCLNNQSNRPSSLPSWVDGRAYNYVVRDVDGNVKYLDGSTQFKPDVAQWRQHMAALDVLPPFNNLDIGASGSGKTYVCNDVDATRLMGCIAGNTKCTVGWAGREAAGSAGSDDLQEALRLDNLLPTDDNANSGAYPFARDLYLSAIGGFENITADCAARGGSAAYCADELAIATAFYTNGSLVQDACVNAGFIKKAAPSCVGAMDVKGTNGACGAPASQLATACEPH